SANYATIGGGYTNTIQTTNSFSTIGGGGFNIIQSNAIGSAIGGGAYNAIQTFSQYSTIGGGGINTIQANAYNATIAGGYDNTIHTGAFLWADSNDFDFSSTANDSFAARAVGGARFVSAIDGGGNPTAGVSLAPGGGSWSSLSDRNAKESFAKVDGREILQHV